MIATGIGPGLHQVFTVSFLEKLDGDQLLSRFPFRFLIFIKQQSSHVLERLSAVAKSPFRNLGSKRRSYLKTSRLELSVLMLVYLPQSVPVWAAAPRTTGLNMKKQFANMNHWLGHIQVRQTNAVATDKGHLILQISRCASSCIHNT